MKSFFFKEHLHNLLLGGVNARYIYYVLLVTKGLLNIALQQPIKKAPNEPRIVSGRECSKKHALNLSEGSIQQGRSHFDARSVLTVREHGKMARTPLAAFFNIPTKGIPNGTGQPCIPVSRSFALYRRMDHE